MIIVCLVMKNDQLKLKMNNYQFQQFQQFQQFRIPSFKAIQQ